MRGSGRRGCGSSKRLDEGMSGHPMMTCDILLPCMLPKDQIMVAEQVADAFHKLNLRERSPKRAKELPATAGK